MEGFNSAVIRDVKINTLPVNNGDWLLEVDVYFDNNENVDGNLSVELPEINTTITQTVEIKNHHVVMSLPIAVSVN